MMRRFIGWMAVFVALHSPVPTEAKDGERSASRREVVVAARQDVSAPSSPLRNSRIFDDASVRQDLSDTGRDRKELTLIRINSRFGEIALRPVVGSIKGAQFSLGF